MHEGEEHTVRSESPINDSEYVVQIPLSELYPFPDHPFKVRDDESMQETAESIKEYGVLVPAIVRPIQDGTYELISGHRRKRACELAGLDTMPCIVRDIDRDTATIIMVDSNLQRENILPSERAKAYKMKLEAIKRQGARHDLTSGQVGPKLDSRRSNQIVADEAGESVKQVQRYIRLTELQPELQKMVDEGKIALTPAVELSYLKPTEQTMLLDTLSSEQATPSLSQAQRMKRLSQEGKLTDDSMLGIMAEQKKPEAWNISLPISRIGKYFPSTYTPQRMEETIIKLLDNWMRKRKREQER
ncbi:MAG: ParB/RepB/Spo0J family partition protein [Clostridia bacterium]|nr:ParB/RepB/Spo0J family partition protein [Clostridia bacterium]